MRVNKFEGVIVYCGDGVWASIHRQEFVFALGASFAGPVNEYLFSDGELLGGLLDIFADGGL